MTVQWHSVLKMQKKLLICTNVFRHYVVDTFEENDLPFEYFLTIFSPPVNGLESISRTLVKMEEQQLILFISQTLFQKVQQFILQHPPPGSLNSPSKNVASTSFSSSWESRANPPHYCRPSVACGTTSICFRKTQSHPSIKSVFRFF